MKPHDMQPHASPGGMVLIRHLSAGSAGSASTMQPPSGNFGGGANTMQYDYSGSYSVSLTVGEDSTAVIDGTDITASSSGSNGVFATDSGTALVNDTSIETMADNSRGLDATYGGTILASKITADTQGDHSAIVATDRGGGSISLADATLSTVGSGSPLLYSTGDIQVNNVSGTSSGSQIAGMEGLNTILIKDSTSESTGTGKTASDPIATASSSTSPPRATRKPAPASPPRSSRSIPHSAPPSDQGRCSTSPTRPPMWCCRTLNLISTPTRRRSRTTRRPAPAQARRATPPITVNVDGTSTWVVTKDTTISALNVASGGGDGNTVTIVANGKTVVSGSGDVTVTVTGSYSTSVSAGSDTIDRGEFDSRFGTSTA